MITTEAGCCQKRGKLVQFAGLGIVKDVWAAETVLCVRNVYAICHEVMAWVEDLDTQGNGAKAELVVSWLHGNWYDSSKPFLQDKKGIQKIPICLLQGGYA